MRVLFALALLAGASGADAQNVVQLRGRVLDATTNAPVPEVIVRLPSLRRYTLTDRDGMFLLGDVPAGVQTLQIVHIAYGERTVRVDVQRDSTHTIRIEPEAIRLDAIVAHDWRRVESVMNGAARGLALRMSGARGDPVFLRTWNREQIVASGLADASAFLRRGPPRVAIRKCAGLAFAGIDQLCVGVPFNGAYGSSRVQDLMFGSLSTTAPGAPRAASTSAALVVLIDDRPVRLEDLAQHDLSAIHRVETFGYRGERGIRMYTEGYLHLVAAGLITPSAGTGTGAAAFEFYRINSDTLPDRSRRNDGR